MQLIKQTKNSMWNIYTARCRIKSTPANSGNKEKLIWGTKRILNFPWTSKRKENPRYVWSVELYRVVHQPYMSSQITKKGKFWYFLQQFCYEHTHTRSQDMWGPHTAHCMSSAHGYIAITWRSLDSSSSSRNKCSIRCGCEMQWWVKYAFPRFCVRISKIPNKPSSGNSVSF